MAVGSKIKLNAGSWFRKLAGWVLRKTRLGGIRPAGVIVIAVTVLVVGLMYVWTRMQIVETGFEISTLENKNNELKKRKRELELEMASLQSPRELENKAAKIGLVFPGMGKVVHVP